MNHPQNSKLRSHPVALTAICLVTLLSITAFAKDTITDVNGVGAVEVPPTSDGDFTVGGPYTDLSGNTVPDIDLYLGSSGLAEWWVNGNQSDPWTDVQIANNYFAYHHREDVADGGSFFAAWSLGAQYFNYTSQFRHTDGQIPNGSIISFGLSDSGNQVTGNWNESIGSGLSDVDVAGGIDLSTYTGPSVTDFSGADAYSWKSYEVTGGATGGTASGSDIFWTLSQPDFPITDYVVFVQLPSGETIDADGRSFTELSDSTMQGLGTTDEIVFNWTIDAKSDTIGNPNPAYGQNVGGRTLGDTVFVDLDRDGVQDPNEAGLEGVTVELLDASGNPVLDESGNAITTTTDAEGDYLFNDFDAGTYKVKFTAPAGYVATTANTGGDDELDSDISPTTGETGLIDMTNTASDSSVDAGYLPRGSAIGDIIFNDADLDGVQDVGETGVSGVTINLLDSNGDPALDGSGNPITTTTDSKGRYFFDNLGAGDYIVEVVKPQDWVVSPQDQGGDDTADSDISTTTNQTGLITLGTNASDTSVDAGLYELASIGNYVWNDENGNGIQDGEEIGLPGVVVNLLDSSGNPVLDGNNDPITATTDANGFYKLSGLPADDYIVEFVTPNGFQTVQPDKTTDDLDSDYIEATGRTAVFTLAQGEDKTDIDAGFDPTFGNFAQIGDTVWNDLDGDGIQDPGEPGLEGIVVSLLDASGNPILDAEGNPTTVTTNANGAYKFVVDPDFDYILEFTPIAGYTHVPQDAGSDDTADSDVDPATSQTGIISLVNDEIRTDIDAGLVQSSIGDTVFVDLDGDGVQDTNEAGIAGVTVELLDASGNPVNDESGNPITATTDVFGNYNITGFDPGTFKLRFTPPAGYTATTADQGGDDTTDSDIDASGLTGLIDMTGPGSDYTVDAGYLPRGNAIGDLVFNDLDADGEQDSGETGVAGVTVNLLDATGTTVLATTTTDANGSYFFDNLTDDDYIVEVELPQDWAYSPQDQVGDTVDSDVDTTTGRTAAISLSGNTVNTTVDAGIYQLGSIGDYVYLDVDGDGKQEPAGGDTGLPGVIVNLLDGTGTTVLATTTSDASGFYEFAGLPAGNYIIDFETPNGFQTVNQDNNGLLDDLDSDYDETTGQTAVISLGQGENITNVDAGYKGPDKYNQIGDTVWNDIDRDGIQDPGEDGVEGVVVKLLDASGNPVLNAEGNPTTVTTDANGNYHFIVEKNTSYILEFVPTSGKTLTTQDAGSDETADSDADATSYRTDLIAVGEQTVYNDIDAGLVGASIGDTVWVDLDGDGVQDAGEAGLSGVTVALLDENGNPVLDGNGVAITDVTDSNGNYELFGFDPGIYTVSFTPPAGYDATTADQGDDALDSDINGSGVTGPIDMTAPGSNFTVDAGFLPIDSAIGDMVFFDLDGDGEQDAGEVGVEGVTVNLLDASGDPVLDGNGDPITTTTDVNGSYFFDGLDAGTYIVEVELPTDWAYSPLNQAGGDDTLDSDIDPATGQTAAITLGTDEVNSTVDAGIYGLGSIGDYVYLDQDGDGKQEPAGGDVGLPGVLVTLLNSDNSDIDSDPDTPGVQPTTTTSDASGFYEFTGLEAGSYKLDFSTPSGFTTVNQDNNGALDDLDSDYDETTGLTATINLAQGEQIDDVDAGYKPPNNYAQIGNTVWFDLNNNGIQDSGEPGIEGVVVKLLDASGNPITDGDGNPTTVTTDANGNYNFFVDPDFDYILEFVPPTGTVFTSQDSGSDDAVDSDVNPATNRTALIQLVDNEVNSDIDAGLLGASIGDQVFLDTNFNGIFDAGDAPLAGITVTLYLDANSDGIPDAGESQGSLVTDSAGVYLFEGLDAGLYIAVVDTADPDLPANALASISEYNSIVLTAGENRLDVDFPFILQATTTQLDKSVTPQGATEVGNVLTYTVTPNHAEGTLLHNVVVTDPVPAGTTYVGASANAGGTLNGDIVTWNLGSNVPGVPGLASGIGGTGTPGTVTSSISQSSDDAEEMGPGALHWGGEGSVYLNSSDIELVDDLEPQTSGSQTVGLRFNGITVPKNATITNAYLRFHAIAGDSPNTNDGATSLTIQGQAADNPTTFVSSTSNSFSISNQTIRPRTTASVAWAPSTWSSGTDYDSPDLKSVVQEVVNRAGWADGNSMVFIITGSGSRSAESFDNTGTNPPELVIEYTPVLASTLNSSMTVEPSLVTPGTTVEVTMTLTSTSDVSGVSPNAPTVTGTNGVGATLVDGPTPATVNLVADTPQTFTWHYLVTGTGDIGQLTFSGDADDNGDNTWAVAQSNSVIVTPPLTFDATVTGTEEIIQNQAFIEATNLSETPSPIVENILLGSVSGHLYIDTNGNGTQDAGEPNLPNVDVVITDSNGDTQTVTTDLSGNWTANVPSGSTTANVDETDPDYPAGSTQSEGTDPTIITAVAGVDTDAGIDGYYIPAAVNGHLYLDTNGNGTQDAGEPNLANVDVLITDSNGTEQTVTTDANGDWTATVPPGDTISNIDETDTDYPTGSTQTEGTDPTTTTAVAGANTPSDNDGFYQPGTVTGHLYLDTNGDGVQDPDGADNTPGTADDEPNLANVDVLVTDSNGTEQTVSSDANGDWTATVPPGSTTANVDETDTDYPTGSTQTEGTDPTVVTAVSGANTDGGIDGYYNPPTTVSGHLYIDSNDNGVQDGGEPNLADIDVLITDSNGDTQTVASDANGNWIATVPAGSTSADVNTNDPDFPAGFVQREGDDPTTVTAIAGTNVDGGIDGYSLNLDSDDDGIPNTVEVSNNCDGDGDTDGDGVPDILDLDSDGDGIFDIVEAGNGALDADKDGRVDSTQGNNGLADALETAPDSGVINYTLPDRDGDLRPDHLDLDSDNDSISDVLEYGNGAIVDAANDGIADGSVNSEGVVPFAGSTVAVNGDSDLQPDYLDVDSNDDGMFDIVDNGFGSLDVNLDGMIDDTTSGDCDGIPDILDPKDEEYGWFPFMGCTAWNLNNEDDTDGDVFPVDQEYAFGGDPELGDHLVTGTTHRAGMTIAKNATGGLDISYVRPQGRFDVTVTPYVSDDPRVADNWTPVSALPTVVDNGDATETVTWSDIHEIDDNTLVTRDRGFVRLRVETPCNPEGSWTLVQGWCRQDIVGKHQTYGVNFSSMPVFTGIVDSAAGSTVTLGRSGKGQNLGTYLTGGVTCFIEFTDGPAEGHRFDITSGGVDTFTLDLASVNNTTGSLPEGLADSHFVVRTHDTLGGIYPNIEWDKASSPGSADQVLLFNGVGYDTYYNLSNLTWCLQGGGFSSRNGLIIAPGTGMMIVHANPNDVNEMLAYGDLRYNDFKRPLYLGSKGLNFMELGYPFDATPAELNMTEANGFVRASSPGSATQIQNWLGDTTPNTTGWETNFLLTSTGWFTQGDLSKVTTHSPLFRECRSNFVLVRIDNLTWTHPLPWITAPWVQPTQPTP